MTPDPDPQPQPGEHRPIADDGDAPTGPTPMPSMSASPVDSPPVDAAPLDEADTADQPAAAARPLADWFAEAARVATFRRPSWPGLPAATPSLLLFLVVLEVIVLCGLQYVAVAGAARFYPEAINSLWLPLLSTTLACWAVCRPVAVQAVAPGERPYATPEASTSMLVVMAILSSLWIVLLSSAIYLPLSRLDVFWSESWGAWALWLVWGAGFIWNIAAFIVLFTRESRSASGSALALVVVLAAAGLQLWVTPASFWYAERGASSSEEGETGRWSTAHLQPDKLLKQAALLDTALASLPEQRPGQVDVYVVTYSPYAGEDVFLGESREVSRVMAERFGAAAHTIQLVNHRSTIESLPWATPDNLRKTLAHLGKLLDADEDMVFIHFASHGGSDGRLASEFWPLQVERLTATDVRAALDSANIPVRMLSISACYSGTWIAPLATEGSLVMTASDDKHTSYGCGRKSKLTFYTRAVFSEQLGEKTLDFEQALANARPIIESREKEAGKDDGFSNPQIHVGAKARERIGRWRQQIEAR